MYEALTKSQCTNNNEGDLTLPLENQNLESICVLGYYSQSHDVHYVSLQASKNS